MGVTLECVEFGFLVSRFMQKMGREWSKRSKKKNLECDAPETEGDYQMKIQTKKSSADVQSLAQIRDFL